MWWKEPFCLYSTDTSFYRRKHNQRIGADFTGNQAHFLWRGAMDPSTWIRLCIHKLNNPPDPHHWICMPLITCYLHNTRVEYSELSIKIKNEPTSVGSLCQLLAVIPFHASTLQQFHCPWKLAVIHKVCVCDYTKTYLYRSTALCANHEPARFDLCCTGVSFTGLRHHFWKIPLHHE